MKRKNYDILNYVKVNDGADFTAQDIADALDMPVKSVNGIITMAFQRHEPQLMFREEHEVEVAEGKHKVVKFIRLTAEGKTFEPDSVEE